MFVDSDKHSSSSGENRTLEHLNALYQSHHNYQFDDSEASDDDFSQITPYFYQQSLVDHQSSGRNFAKFLSTHLEMLASNKKSHDEPRSSFIAEVRK